MEYTLIELEDYVHIYKMRAEDELRMAAYYQAKIDNKEYTSDENID